MSLIKVNKNKNPYHIIGEYIEKHITYVDDIIAVISLDGNIINELFLVEITTESNFIWQNDWWEGEENVELIDFFFVSDACKRCDNNDLISRQQAIDEFYKYPNINWTTLDVMEKINSLPSAQPEIIRCKDCKHHWTHKCMDSMPIERCDLEQTFYDAEHDFCSLAERREVTT